MSSDLDKHDEWRKRIALLGARPFYRQVVQSPLSTVSDVASLHREAKRVIAATVAGCKQQEAVRCVTVVGPAGYGKTHLLAWARQLAESGNETVFAYVPPLHPRSPSPEQHVIRSVVGSLDSQSRKQKAAFEAAVRGFLVRCYDGILDAGPRARANGLLGVAGWWDWWLRPSGLRIGKQHQGRQEQALRSALSREPFLLHAFAELQAAHPGCPPGVALDRDAFIAACLLACGEASQRAAARDWFDDSGPISDVQRLRHFRARCHGTEKILNGLFTLRCLSGRAVCLAFDQLDDTVNALWRMGANESISALFGLLIRNLCAIPGFCLLLGCESSVWQHLVAQAPAMLIDRIIQGNGAQVLLPLREQAALDLVRESLRLHVWDGLGVPPPDADGLFPFTTHQVQRFRADTGGEPRPFLQMLHDAFERWQDGPPPSPPRLVLDSVSPAQVPSEEPTPLLIKGRHLPSNVVVLFAGQPSPTPAICRPDMGEIDVAAPVGLMGDIEATVRDAENAENNDSLAVRFVSNEPTRPYCRSIDHAKLKAHREARKSRERWFTQTWVAEQVGTNQPQLSLLERGRWLDADDDLYEKLAAIYGQPLSAFRKD